LNVENPRPHPHAPNISEIFTHSISIFKFF
jgi:hypothetical protein